VHRRELYRTGTGKHAREQREAKIGGSITLC
jgi:hypothetical protein